MLQYIHTYMHFYCFLLHPFWSLSHFWLLIYDIPANKKTKNKNKKLHPTSKFFSEDDKLMFFLGPKSK